jgi:hypothetical protein
VIIHLPLRQIVGAVAVVAVLVGSFHVGRTYEQGKQLDRVTLIRDAAVAFDGAVAAHVATIKPIHKTIQTLAKEVIHEVPVYSDCVSAPAVERLLDAARANRSPAVSEAGVPD